VKFPWPSSILMSYALSIFTGGECCFDCGVWVPFPRKWMLRPDFSGPDRTTRYTVLCDEHFERLDPRIQADPLFWAKT
jgi:hypothetical protein